MYDYYVIKKGKVPITERVVEMANIKITWVTMGYLGVDRDARILELINKGYTIKGNATAELEFDFPAGDILICNAIYANTNSYTGEFWNALQAVIPADRPHTALSIGDRVSIDGREYVCSEIGFTLVA